MIALESHDQFLFTKKHGTIHVSMKIEIANGVVNEYIALGHFILYILFTFPKFTTPFGEPINLYW